MINSVISSYNTQKKKKNNQDIDTKEFLLFPFHHSVAVKQNIAEVKY